MKKYRELSYGEFAPEVLLQPPFEDPPVIDDDLRARLNREGEAGICAEFSRVAAYPRMMEVRVRRTALKAGGGEVPLRIYHPLGAARAAVLFCHGGSFCFNSLEVYDYVLRYWARSTVFYACRWGIVWRRSTRSPRGWRIAGRRWNGPKRSCPGPKACLFAWRVTAPAAILPPRSA